MSVPLRGLPFFPLYSFSIPLLFLPLRSWSLYIWVFNFSFYFPAYLLLSFVFAFQISSFLSFLICFSFPKPSVCALIFSSMWVAPLYSLFLLVIFSLPTQFIIVWFFYHAIFLQFSVLSPFSSLSTSHQISPVSALWLEPFSIWTNTSKQSLQSRHPQVHLT